MSIGILEVVLSSPAWQICGRYLLPRCRELTGLIDKHSVRWAKAAGIDKETFIIPCDCPRFQSGDAKVW